MLCGKIASGKSYWADILQREQSAVKEGLERAYYVDEGLLKKQADAFQVPEPDEIDTGIKDIRKRNNGV